jgi:chain length determinant protein
MTNGTQTLAPALPSPERDSGGQSARRIEKLFRWIIRSILLMSLLTVGYWIFSSDRYVSEATVIIQNTEQIGVPTLDIATVLGGIGGVSRPDQLLLREHLLSVDMLKKLDAALNLRAHYSDSQRDIASRMWFKDASIEWFHRHYLSRVEVTFDDYAGVLRIRAQAYDAATAQAIAAMLVKEGERFMNEMSHALARAQVDFLDKQVALAQEQVLQSTKALLDFQNQKGLASPRATVESIYAIIAKLEGQRTELQTQLASLPRNLDRNHPTKKSLQQSLQAVERQIAREHAKVASPSGKPLNSLVEEEQRLELDLKFKQDLYKTSLVGLEKGRMDAARTLKQVSVLQMPVLPEYAWEPRRIYGVIATLCITLLVIGIINLLKAVILDHVD